MRRDPSTPAGTVHRLTLTSDVLADNFLRDPATRVIDVYVPHGHSGPRSAAARRSRGFHRRRTRAHQLAQFHREHPRTGGPADRIGRDDARGDRVSRLLHQARRKPVHQQRGHRTLGGFPDRGSRALCRAEIRLRRQGKRGVFGKSSGGYGAIVHAMLYPHFWAASACHSGDMGFELLELNDMPRVLRALAKEGGSIQRWLEAFFAKRKVKDDDVHVLMWLAMCATYDPDTSRFMGIRLPVDPETCEVIPERWANWLRWDPADHGGDARGGTEDSSSCCSSIAATSTSTTWSMARGASIARSSGTVCRTSTRNSPTTTRPSTTAWTSACRCSRPPFRAEKRLSVRRRNSARCSDFLKRFPNRSVTNFHYLNLPWGEGYLGALAALSGCRLPNGRATTFTAEITDQDGKPVANAVVSLVPDPTTAMPGASTRLPERDSTSTSALKRFFRSSPSFRRNGRIVFANSDPTTHQVYSFSPVKQFEITLARGTSSPPIVFPNAGRCGARLQHPRQHDRLCVRRRQPVDRSHRTDGRAVIDDVPPGNYQAQVWHHRYPPRRELPSARIAVSTGHHAMGGEYQGPEPDRHPLARGQLLGGGDDLDHRVSNLLTKSLSFRQRLALLFILTLDRRSGAYCGSRLWRRAREPGRAGQEPAGSDDASLHAAAQRPLRARERRCPRSSPSTTRCAKRSPKTIAAPRCPRSETTATGSARRGCRSWLSTAPSPRTRQAKPRKEPRSRSPICWIGRGRRSGHRARGSRRRDLLDRRRARAGADPVAFIAAGVPVNDALLERLRELSLVTHSLALATPLPTAPGLWLRRPPALFPRCSFPRPRPCRAMQPFSPPSNPAKASP